MGGSTAAIGVYQFKVVLREADPPIWRQIQVPRRYTFWDLHVAIQDAFGWRDYHLHMFRVPVPTSDAVLEVGIPDEDMAVVGRGCLAGWELPIAPFFPTPGGEAEYLYDFGDDWQHSVVFEGAFPLERGAKYPRCLAGGRAGPPEDCGGVHGYEQLLQTLGDPKQDGYQAALEWTGGPLDPEAFDAAAVTFDDPRMRWRRAFRGPGH